MSMAKKYKLTSNVFPDAAGRTLYQIRALKDFADVKAGDLGGYIEGEHNLFQAGTCWLYSGIACDQAQIYDDAKVTDSELGGMAQVYGNAEVLNSTVEGKAEIYGEAKVAYSKVGGKAKITGNARFMGEMHNGKIIGTKYHFG